MDSESTPVKSGNRVKCEECNAEAIITSSNGGLISCCGQAVSTTFAS